MADPEQQLREDRALRNDAKGLVKNSIDNVKGDMAQRGFGARVASRAKDGAAQIADDSADFVRSHGNQLGTGLVFGALALVGWMFRGQIADAIYELVNQDEDAADEADPEPEAPVDDLHSD
ncbi:hypothetical protein [Aurantiacibacter gilvus]|uniref:DUF3618 domain-containing protein n=1 Tax=Aurantiacibacter gilvus TaxID=3139141 RepID=A0ABU9ID45_9SPHN